MARQCYHCKQWIEEGEEHDCWTTTEEALTEDLSDDLQEAYERLRESAVEFGEQRIYASHHSIMFARSSCYFFVRPKKSYLEVVVFLGRALKAPQVKRADEASGLKVANFIRITHRDQVEPPVTDWLKEAYEWAEKKKKSRKRNKKRKTENR
jgi:TfoX/Sxy family transcriptional regulator of competence genes